MLRIATLSLCTAVLLTTVVADEPRAENAPAAGTLEFTKWSGHVNVPDPVAISLDNYGRAYITQTQRRKIQDLDIREHRDWISHDLSFQSVDDKRNFYRSHLAIGNDTQNARHVGDINNDGHHDHRDLAVIPEKIHLLKDNDSDGTADTIKVVSFPHQFMTEVTGIAAGILHYGDSVYATVAPDVWRMRDTNNDGTLDHGVKIATGFGLHIAYAGHDMHGLTVGPDGKIYWSIGDKGIHANSHEGRIFHYPNQGGVMRCNPDGSEFEVFAHGLRNVQELAFDQYGNLFGVDNDADKPNERERFVYIVKGMDAGWRCNYQYRGDDYNPWTDEQLWVPWYEGQAAYIVPPICHSIDGPAGFAFNPGTALSPTYRDYFFLAGAPGGKQIAFQAKPSGATFEMVNEHVIGSTSPIVGINFGPDGGLYGVDWGGGYPLNQNGAVWKIDNPQHATSELRLKVKRLLADGFAKKKSKALVKHLQHPDQRIRLSAQFELVKRQRVGSLKAAAAGQNTNQSGRIHAIWGLGQLARGAADAIADDKNPDSNVMGAAEVALTALLTNPDEPDHEIVVQLLRTIGDLQKFDGELLIPFVAHPSARVRFAAALALGDHPTPSAFETLVSLGSQLKMSEVYLRMALARGLSACATAEQLSGLRENESTLLQLAAIVALRRTSNAGVAGYLTSRNPFIATEAARAIHDDFSIPEALPDLAATLTKTPHFNEAYLRRAISAAFRIGTSQQAAELAEFAVNENAPAALRIDALNALRVWNEPPALDRVTGRYRDLSIQNRSIDTQQLAPNISRLILDSDSRIRATALSAAAKLDILVDKESLLAIVNSTVAAANVRLAALNVLVGDDATSHLPHVRKLLKSDESALRMRSLELLSEHEAVEAIQQIKSVLAQPDHIAERQHAVMQLGGLNHKDADEVLAFYFQKAATGLFPEIRLELISATALRSKTNARLAAALSDFNDDRETRSRDNVTSMFDECIEGGDAEEGRQLFRTHLAAQCIRCHRVGRQGSNVGPNLDDVATRRDAKYLLRSIIAPSADIDKKYRTQVVLMASGKVHQGLMKSRDDDSITLTDAQGKDILLNSDDVEEVIEQQTSIMPEMIRNLSRREIRDLVAYLRTLNQQK